MRGTFNSCDVYVGGWCLYSLQGSLYPSGGILSQGILLCLLLYSLYVFFWVNFTCRLSFFMKSVNILLFMFTIYGVWLILGGERRYITGNPVANFEYLKRICMSFLPMFVFYYFTLFAKLTEKRLRAYSLLFFVVTCFSFVNNYNNQLQRALVSGSSQEEFTNNVGYEFVALLPLLYAWRKHVFIQYLFLFALSCFVFMAMKRGAILIHCICVVVFVYEMHKVLKGRRRLRMIFLLMLLLVILQSGSIICFPFMTAVFISKKEWMPL